MNRTFLACSRVILALGLLSCFASGARAGLVTWSTGDLGNNVIDDGGSFTVNPDLIDPRTPTRRP